MARSAAFASLLFAAGRLAIAYDLEFSTTSSVYRPVASVAVILVWVCDSAQLFFLGAEFTHLYAARCGSRVASRDAS